MKSIYLILFICICVPIYAQDVVTPPSSATPPSTTTTSNALPPTMPAATQVPASEVVNAPSGTPSQSGQSPFSLGGLSSADNSAILNMLNSQANLTDLTGKKVDEAQQRLIRSRFEKYLNTPPAASAEDIAYNQLLVDISQRLAGKGGGSDNERTIDAWRMLFNAENYPMDDNLCRTIADKVVNFWQTTRKIEKLLLQNEALEKDRTRKESGIRIISSMDRRDFIDMMRGKDATPPPHLAIMKWIQLKNALRRRKRKFRKISRMKQLLELTKNWIFRAL